MIRVGVLVTGGSDLRPTEIAVEVADRDSPDLTSRLLAALRSEIERRRCSVPGASPAVPDDSPETPVVVEPDA